MPLVLRIACFVIIGLTPCCSGQQPRRGSGVAAGDAAEVPVETSGHAERGIPGSGGSDSQAVAVAGAGAERAAVRGAAGAVATAGTTGGTGAAAPAAGRPEGAAGSSGGGAGRAGTGRDAPNCAATGAEPKQLSLTGNLGTHDPSIIEAGDAYFVFQTGPGLPIKRSSDLVAWKAAGSVFARNPEWIAQKVAGATDLWAPDISFFGGVYHVYYSASTSGSNHSCIGHAISPTPDGGWTDQGPVVCSNAGGAKDDWNAIDPNFVQDDSGRGFLVFGSFWGGIKMIELDDKGARASDKLIALAARQTNNGAIEAPFVVRHCGYYYLFVSFDKCCSGASSTYKIMVGRSDALTGPYADKQGVPMLKGGGSLLVKENDAWHGPGHSAVITTKGRSYDVHHAYFAGANSGAYRTGGSYLRVSDLAWGTDGWPTSGGP